MINFNILMNKSWQLKSKDVRVRLCFGCKCIWENILHPDACLGAHVKYDQTENNFS